MTIIPKPGPPAPVVENATNFGSTPDGLQRLWTPHRLAYVGGDQKPPSPAEEDCPFCRVATHRVSDVAKDVAELVVARGKTCYVNLNLYPYNPGHLMALPYRHVASYADLTPEETGELAAMTQTAMHVLTAEYRPDGFNLGMNQGAVAGAGIAGHLHQHIVPRWTGDANFLPIVAQTKAVPELLADTRARLAAAWTVRPQPTPPRVARARIVRPAGAPNV
ncbi:MAG: HIT domain-containing protein [Promicromonosporaceae bacterium]|nr:HIT domain-containing protein [Promicromonosporaceae bacterium]